MVTDLVRFLCPSVRMSVSLSALYDDLLSAYRSSEHLFVCAKLFAIQLLLGMIAKLGLTDINRDCPLLIDEQNAYETSTTRSEYTNK